MEIEVHDVIANDTHAVALVRFFDWDPHIIDEQYPPT